MSVSNAFLCINENQIKSRVISNFLSHLQFTETDEELHRNTFFLQAKKKLISAVLATLRWGIFSFFFLE